MHNICINTHKYAFGGTWGVPPGTPGNAKGCQGGFLIDFRSFWGPFLEPSGTLWGSLSVFQAIKYGKGDQKM